MFLVIVMNGLRGILIVFLQSGALAWKEPLLSLVVLSNSGWHYSSMFEHVTWFSCIYFLQFCIFFPHNFPAEDWIFLCLINWFIYLLFNYSLVVVGYADTCRYCTFAYSSFINCSIFFFAFFRAVNQGWFW